MEAGMRVAFIGAGGIGGAMAERLTKSGFDLTVCDLRAEALEPLKKLGAKVTQRVAECAGAELVILMVANDAQVKDASNALLAAVDAAKPPRLVIMSSVLPATVREVAAAAAKKNVRTLDAPVSGGRVSASNGALTIMAGGDAADLEAVRPVLAALGTRIEHCGPLGSGESVKIVNNILGVANMFLMTEASRLAQELGIDVGWLAGVMETSSGRNLATRDYEAHKGLYRYNVQSSEILGALLAVCRKDLSLAKALADSSGLALPILDAVKEALDQAPNKDIGESWRRLVG
jgi:3-hydroxyisobutyrate dehydrogenase